MSARLRRLHASKIKWMFYWEKNIYKRSWDYRYTYHFTMVMQTAVSVHPPSCFLPNQDFCSHLQVQWQEPLLIPMIHFETYATFFIWYFSVTEYIRPLPLLLSSVIYLSAGYRKAPTDIKKSLDSSMKRTSFSLVFSHPLYSIHLSSQHCSTTILP